MFKLSAAAALVVTLTCGSAHASAPKSRCVMSPAEARWVDGALRAWELVRTKKLHLADRGRPKIIFFDARCRFESKSGGRPGWSGEPHAGHVRLPDGGSVPPAVTSFTASDDKTGLPFFVMALPPVWDTQNKLKSLGLDGLTGVFLHEFTHARQARFVPLFDIPDGINDDSLQEHFQADPAYVAAYQRERDLLYASAAEPDQAKARNLAAEALATMRARQARWFSGADSYWKRVDDLFLTMEGSGQWSSYSWLVDPKGRNMNPLAAQEKVRANRKWWTQDEGLAVFLVVDRLLPGWQGKLFAPTPTPGIDLLAEAVGARNSSNNEIPKRD